MSTPDPHRTKRRFSRCLAGPLFFLTLSANGLEAPADQRTLLELAREQFAPTPLTEGEEKLFVASERGEEASMQSANQDENYVCLAAGWPNNRVVRASTLRWLCLDKKASERVTAQGIRIRGVRIDGPLDLSDAKIDFPIRAAGCAFDGVIKLNGTRTRSLDFSGCSLQMLLAHGAEIGGDFLLTDAVAGDLHFSGATIAGALDCRGSSFSNLIAEGAKFAQSVDLRSAKGRWVNLLGASIGGSLDADGADLYNPGSWWSLLADRAKITGNAFLRRSRTTGQPFRAAGQVNFLGATIGGSLECDGAELSDPPANEPLFLVDRARIAGSIFLRDGFCCDGLADFKGTEASSLVWIAAKATQNTELDLQSTKIGVLHSDNATWPKAKNVKLDGFVYGRLNDPGGIDSTKLLAWLALQPDKPFYPQPYEQLASVLRTMGFEGDAREVMLEKNRQHRKFTKAPSPEWWWYGVFGRAIGYGYLPSRAFLMSLGLIVIGFGFFRFGYQNGLITPAKDSAYEKKDGPPAERPIAENYPRFNAFVYSLESFTPLLKLEQSSHWTPNANRRTELHLGRVTVPITGSLLRAYLWCHIILGWILSSLWVGSITGLVKT